MKIDLSVLLVRPAVILMILHVFLGNAAAQKKFLFDATKAETAGNADWVIDEDSNTLRRFPTPDQSTITASTPETYWTGALSSWGIALVKMGHHVETLPAGTAISFGDSLNPQDLKNYDVYIVDEPNIPFTGPEKTAVLQFVQNGGGLFMISDHAGADRNNDGWDPVRVWNDLLRTNLVQALPFGMLLDSNSISETTTNLLADASNPILHGSAGPVTKLKFSAGATITVNTAANPTVRGLIWRTGVSQSLTNVMVACASFGLGKVCLVGDSSPADDSTGASGNTLYPGWTEVGVSHANIHLNGSVWLATKEPTLDLTDGTRQNPRTFLLGQNYPNPFNPSTRFTFQLAEEGYVSMKIFDLLGKEVATLVNDMRQAGTHSVTWNASGFSSGMYFCRLQIGANSETKKMNLMK